MLPCVHWVVIGEEKDTLVGTVIDDRYQVLTHLGRGGMGSVYCAEHLGLGRHVALKVLRREHSENPQFRLRFEREIRATAAIDHPHVVSVFDTGALPDGSLYYTMELIDGESLQARLRRERIIDWSTLHPLALQLSRGLEAAHSRGIVHRDLKPSNIVVMVRPGEPEQTKIIDFGIAKLLRDETTGQITKTGAVLGTLAYMAPEQLKGQGDHRMDIYALGVILYQCLAGRRPFVGSEVEVFGAILHTNPQPLSEVAVAPAMLSSLVMQMMARSPDDRPQTMRAVADALLMIDVDAPLPSQPDSTRTVPLPFGDAAPAFGASSDTTGSTPTILKTQHTRPQAGRRLTSDSRTLTVVGGGILALGLAATIAWAFDKQSQALDINELGSPAVETAAEELEMAAGRSSVEDAVMQVAPDTEATSASGATNALQGTDADPSHDLLLEGATAEALPTTPGDTGKEPAPREQPTELDDVDADDEARASVVEDPAPQKRPKKLSLEEALARATKRAGDKCPSILETRIKVEVTIDNSGALRSRRILPPHETTSTGECILGIFDAQRFPKGGGPTTTTLVVKPRPPR